MKTALRLFALFALVFGCSAAMGAKFTFGGWITGQLVSGESASFATGGPDGNIWATEQAKGQILKINLDGSVTRYSLPANTIPLQITAGPDGNFWFSGGQLQGGSPVSIIGRVTTEGAITIFNYPEARAFTLLSSGPIAGSSDGKVYVVNTASKKIGIINPAASVSSLVVNETALAFDSVGITLIASRQSGGIDYCGQSAKDCGTLINGVRAPFSLPAGSPTGVSECLAGMICISATNTLGATASKFWLCDSSGANCTSVDFLDDGCGAGKLSCTGPDCVAAAAPALNYNSSCQDTKAADLSASPPNLYKIGGPGGVNITDIHFYLPPQGGLNVVALVQNPATHDGNVAIGKVTVAVTPPKNGPDLTVAKQMVTFARVGGWVYLSFRVTNIGNQNSGDWYVLDPLPPGLELLDKGKNFASTSCVANSIGDVFIRTLEPLNYDIPPGEKNAVPLYCMFLVTRAWIVNKALVVAYLDINHSNDESNALAIEVTDPRDATPIDDDATAKIGSK